MLRRLLRCSAARRRVARTSSSSASSSGVPSTAATAGAMSGTRTQMAVCESDDSTAVATRA